MDRIALSVEQRAAIAGKKAVCPFLGPAVGGGDLPVSGSAARPLAAIADIVALGDSGGGDLGSKVLKLFARGNHSRLPGPSEAFDLPTPPGMMSLDLAGSQGAHPGHSGILLGDPAARDAGRFSAADFARLAGHADAAGRLTTQAIGAFIAENLARDPNSKVLPLGRLAGDLFGLADEIGDSLWARLTGRHRPQDTVELCEKLTRLAGADNLVGSAGEFGLLFAFLAHRPEPHGERAQDGDPAIRLADAEEMFVHHRLPDGWETWPKQAADWLHATTRITAAAAKAYVKQNLKARRASPGSAGA
jgi:hypothetical protein